MGIVKLLSEANEVQTSVVKCYKKLFDSALSKNLKEFEEFLLLSSNQTHVIASLLA